MESVLLYFPYDHGVCNFSFEPSFEPRYFIALFPECLESHVVDDLHIAMHGYWIKTYYVSDRIGSERSLISSSSKKKIICREAILGKHVISIPPWLHSRQFVVCSCLFLILFHLGVLACFARWIRADLLCCWGQYYSLFWMILGYYETQILPLKCEFRYCISVQTDVRVNSSYNSRAQTPNNSEAARKACLSRKVLGQPELLSLRTRLQFHPWSLNIDDRKGQTAVE